MTLILTMANERQVILISDRRLSVRGKPTDEESNKASTFICRDARLAVGFTGLAKAGSFQTSRWLLEALTESAAPDYLMRPTISRFSKRATIDIGRVSKTLTKPKIEKRLSVVLAGYSYVENPPLCYCVLVSNFDAIGKQPLVEASDDFGISYWREQRPSERPMGLIVLFGASESLTPSHTKALKSMLQKDSDPQAIVDKGVEALRATAESPASNNLIGKQCTSIVLPRAPEAYAFAQYHSAQNVLKTYAPSYIEARGGDFGAFMIDSPEFESLDPSGGPVVTSVPKVGRNEPCPCNSGRKYKKCHGGPLDQGGLITFGS